MPAAALPCRWLALEAAENNLTERPAPLQALVKKQAAVQQLSQAPQPVWRRASAVARLDCLLRPKLLPLAPARTSPLKSTDQAARTAFSKRRRRQPAVLLVR